MTAKEFCEKIGYERAKHSAYEIMCDSIREQGYESCFRGARIRSNPFHLNSPWYKIWREGWEMAKGEKERERAEMNLKYVEFMNGVIVCKVKGILKGRREIESMRDTLLKTFGDDQKIVIIDDLAELSWRQRKRGS